MKLASYLYGGARGVLVTHFPVSQLISYNRIADQS
jgi:hypothetical protein